jgi:hypothetical protein
MMGCTPAAMESSASGPVAKTGCSAGTGMALITARYNAMAMLSAHQKQNFDVFLLKIQNIVNMKYGSLEHGHQ